MTEGGARRLIHGLLHEFYCSVVKTGAFKHRKAVSFQIGLCSYLCNYRRNINSGAITKDGIFSKSP